MPERRRTGGGRGAERGGGDASARAHRSDGGGQDGRRRIASSTKWRISSGAAPVRKPKTRASALPNASAAFSAAETNRPAAAARVTKGSFVQTDA